MKVLKNIIEPLSHLIFPHLCASCGDDSLQNDQFICLKCILKLPVTGFSRYDDNPMEKIFWGRLPFRAAMSAFYFNHGSVMQHLMHEFKYRSHINLGLFLGRQMGHHLLSSGRFESVEGLIAVPLHPHRLKKRKFNQAEIICRGIESVIHKPFIGNILIRQEDTDSQTKMGRIQRWKNMEGKFRITDHNSVRGKHILLVDDVVTTGATLEACGRALLGIERIELSLASLCIAKN